MLYDPSVEIAVACSAATGAALVFLSAFLVPPRSSGFGRFLGLRADSGPPVAVAEKAKDDDEEYYAKYDTGDRRIGVRATLKS